jgi:hypothetical protein
MRSIKTGVIVLVEYDKLMKDLQQLYVDQFPLRREIII